MKKSYGWLLLIVCLSQSVFALDPQKTINQYGHETRTHQNGLPGEAVYEIVQTPDGYLWLRTSSGLVRFDGARFVRIEPKIAGQLLQETIRAISTSADGNLLVRSETRTLLYRDNSFSDYSSPAPLPDGAILEIFETKDRKIFIGSDNFVYQIHNQAISQLLAKTGWATQFLEDNKGNLWIVTASGLFKYAQGSFTQYASGFHQAFIETTERVNRVPNGSYPIKGLVTAIAEDRRGHLWLGTRDGLYEFSMGELATHSSVIHLKGRHISTILQDKDGNIWAGSDTSGLHLLSNGKWSSMTATEGLSDNAVISLCQDREGSIWVGTKSGLDRFRNNKLISYTTREGLVHNNAISMIEGRDGQIYIFSSGGGLTRFKDGVARVFTTREGLVSIYGGTLYECRDGSLWIGTDHGISRLKGDVMTTYQADERLAKFYTSAIIEDDESLILSTSELRVYRFRDGKLSNYTINGEQNPFTGIYVFTIIRDQSGDLWFGTVNGLYKISKGRPASETKQQQIDFPVTSIYDDQKGSLWLGGRTAGLVRLRKSDGRLTMYRMQDGLFDNEVLRVLSDNLGNLWVSTPRGIYTVSCRELDDFAEGRIRNVKSTSYNTADGMKTTECTGQAQPAGWKGRDGRLWFTTRKGVVMIDPNNLTRNEVIPPVAIEEVVVDQESIPAGNNIELAPGKRGFEFHYNGLSLVIPERVRFKYRLEGYDQDWIDAGARRVAYYTNLLPGKYRFRVIASNNDGLWNNVGASYEFYLRPHFYQRVWFYLLCAALVGLIGLGIHRLRVGQMKARFSAVLAERKRIASELHDTVEQGLAMILLHLESGAARMLESPQAARQHLELARQMVKHSLIETRHSVLELYSQELENRDLVTAVAKLAEQLTTGTTVKTEIQINGVSRDLTAVEGHHLLLLCKEAITNALKHAQASQVKIALSFEPQSVRVCVHDNGCGFDPDSPLHLSGGHFGLVGMRERIKKLGGQLTLNSRPGTGTEVVILVPTT